MDKKTREFFDRVLNEEPYTPDPNARLTFKQAINAMKSPENWASVAGRVSRQVGIKGFFKKIKDRMDVLNDKLIGYFSYMSNLIKSKFKQTDIVSKKEVSIDKEENKPEKRVEENVEEKLAEEAEEIKEDIQNKSEKTEPEKIKEEKAPETKKEEPEEKKKKSTRKRSKKK